MKKVYLAAFIIFSFRLLAQNLSSSLTACYPLNGNATDMVNSLNGTLGAGVTPTLDRFNNPASAYAFNGSPSAYIQLPNNALLKASHVSFSCWVRLSTLSTSQFIAFVTNGCVSNQEGYQLAFAANAPAGPRFQIAKATANCGTQFILNGTTAPLTQTWYHIGFYAGADSLKLYVNGALNAVMATGSTPLAYSSTASVYLGGSVGATANLPLSGVIDNARFYNRKLTGQEMMLLYTQDPACVSGPPPVSAFSVSAFSLCVNQPLALKDLSSNSPTAWSWQMPGAFPAQSSVNNPVVSYPQPGTYQISLTASNSFGPGTTTVQTVVVWPLPVISINPSSAQICQGGSVVLTASGAATYSWSGPASSSPSITVSPTASAVYTVTGVDANGCANTAAVSVIVNSCTSLLAQASEALQLPVIYPNPTAGTVEIAPMPVPRSYELYNALGQKVLAAAIAADTKGQIDLGHQAGGIYFLAITSEGKKTVQKIVKTD